MTAGDYPITLITTSFLGLLYTILCLNVVRARLKAQIAIGHADPALEQTFRAQANFSEYVPMCLILLGLLENAGTSSVVLLGLSTALITARVLHVWGMMQPQGLGIGRRIGAVVTVLLLAVMSVMGLAIFYG